MSLSTLVDGADALDGVEQDRPDAAEGDDDDLHAVADAEQQHEDRHQHRRRDGPEELQHRLEHAAHACATCRSARRARHRDDGGERVAGGQPEQAGQHVGGQPRPEPLVHQALEDLRQRREEEVGAVRRWRTTSAASSTTGRPERSSRRGAGRRSRRQLRSLRRVPGQRPALDRPEHQVDQHAEEPGDHDERVDRPRWRRCSARWPAACPGPGCR